MPRKIQLLGSALAVAMTFVTACGDDAENPATATTPTATPTPVPLAVTIAWAVAPPLTKSAVPAGDSSQSYTFTATVTGGVSPYTYAWQFNDGTPLGSENPVTHQFMRPGTYAIHVVVTDAAGNAARSDANVGGALELQISPTAFSLTCRSSQGVGRGQFTFAAVPSGNVGPVAWRWDFGDGSRSSERITSHVYSVHDPGEHPFTATVTATDSLERPVSCSTSVSVPLCVGSTYAIHRVDLNSPGWSYAGWPIAVVAGGDLNAEVEWIRSLLSGFLGVTLSATNVRFDTCW